MNQEAASHPSQSQINTLSNINVGKDFIFQPTQIMYVSVDEIKTRELKPASPYKGLKKFTKDDKQHFFGRDQLILSLMQDLDRSNLILLLGASGSGKSSVVLAGLIPRLQENWGTNFTEVIFKPDHDPFLSLFSGLLAKGFNQAEVSQVLGGEVGGLNSIVATLRQDGSRWLIYIDQFEELFTISDSVKRDSFIASLVQLYQSLEANQENSVKIVMTMRADFLDRFSRYPELGSIVQGNMRLITDMHREEIWLAIEQPAAQHGVVFEEGLVGEIIKDFQGQAGTLPLLQYTLDLLWKSDNIADPNDPNKPHPTTDKTLNKSTYRNLGGVRKALETHVAEVFESLKPEEKEAARRIFLSLVDITASTESGTSIKAVSRRANRSKFVDVLSNTVLIKLINENLLVSNKVPNQEATIEIAHEALLSSWDKLKEWVNDAHQVIALKNRIEQGAKQRKEALKNRLEAAVNDEYCLRGSQLETALEQRNSGTFDLIFGGLSEEETEFIDVSLEWRDRLLREREEQIRQLDRALTEATLREQSSRVKDIINNKPLEGIIRAIQAIGINLSKLPDKTIDSVEANFLDAVENSRESNSWTIGSFFDGSAREIVAVSLSANGDVISISRGQKEISRKLFIWTDFRHTANEGVQLHTDRSISLSSSDSCHSLVSISRDTKTIASAVGNSIYIYDSYGSLVPPFFQHEDQYNSFSSVKAVLLTSDGSRILSINDYSVCLWSRDGSLIKEFDVNENDKNLQRFRSGALSDTGNLIVCSYDSGFLVFLDDSLNPLFPAFKAHEVNHLYKIEISQDEKFIISGASDQVKLWNTKGELLGEPLGFVGHHNVVVTISPNSRYIAASSRFEDKIYFWDRAILDIKGKPTLKLLKGSGASALNFDSTSQTLISGSPDGEIKLWDISSSLLAQLPKTRSASPGSINISFDGEYIGQTQSSQLYGNEAGHIWNRCGNLVGQNLSDLAPLLKEPLLKWFTDNTISNDANEYRLIHGHGFWTWWFATVQERLQDTKFGTPLFSNEDDRSFSGDARNALFWSIDINENFSLVSISLDGKTIVSSTDKGLLQFWDQALNVIGEVTVEHDKKVTSIAISHDGKIIATSSQDRTVKLWNQQGERITPPLEHEYPVTSVTFSTSGKIIISLSQSDIDTDQKVIKLWNLEGNFLGKLLRLNGDGNPTLAISPDCNYIVTDVTDTSYGSPGPSELRLWQVRNIQGWLQIACDRLMAHPALRNSTSEEAIAACKTCQEYVWIPRSHELEKQGIETLKRKDFQSAIKLLSQAIDLNVDCSGAYLNRGLAYANVKIYENAIRDFSQVISKQPDNSTAYRYRGLCYVYLGNKQAAITDLQEVVQLYQNQGRITEAEKVLSYLKKLQL